METIIVTSNERGQMNLGWLQARYSFSFSNYYEPAKLQFGMLRVLNDDIIAPAMGFGTHPHDNMEIISIPLSGVLSHKDSMGNGDTIMVGEVQVMSAGSGLEHSEKNASTKDSVNLLQIWILPDKKNITPVYNQKNFNWNDIKNKWIYLVSNHIEAALNINQNAQIFIANIDKGVSLSVNQVNIEMGYFAFVINGAVNIAEQSLELRDSMKIRQADTIEILGESDLNTILIIEVPLH
ncbi:MAG: pirin family protein [Bacteroidota bacterium]|nr:pirin family protein [Bacteroidota bacterium]